MNKVIQTGKFVIVSDRKYLKVSDDDSCQWTGDIKDATTFDSQKLAIMVKYAHDLDYEKCTVIELITKK